MTDINLSNLSVSEIMQLRAALASELKTRGIVRTQNIVGDLAETLFAKAFNWTLKSSSNSAYDATDAAGNRYQIKARQCSSETKTVQFSAIRDLHSDSFDYFAFVLFNEDYSIRLAMIMTRTDLIPLCHRQEYTNADNPIINVNRVKSLQEAKDVTEIVANEFYSL